MKLFRKSKFRQKYDKLPSLQKSIVDFLIDVVVIFCLVALIIKPFFIAPFRVQQQSMEPNIHDGEYIIVWKTPYVLGQDYARNDIVVFKPETSDKNYLIKRVIGLPGETLRFTAGQVWVKEIGAEDFRPLAEDFLSDQNQDNTCLSVSFCSEEEQAKKIDIEVPAGKYFLMGDNRLHSRDSRSCFLGSCPDDSLRFVDPAKIEGKAILVFARIWESGGKTNFSLKSARWVKDIEE